MRKLLFFTTFLYLILQATAQIDDACMTVKCAQCTKCVDGDCVFDGAQDGCTTPCATVLCPEDKPVCEVQGTEAVCVEQGTKENACNRVDCAPDRPYCEVINDEPVCRRRCELSIQTGRCRGSFPMFAYDQKLRKCVDFTYGGCDGNENRFETIEECQVTCGGGDGAASCAAVSCLVGQQCQVVDGQAQCVQQGECPPALGIGTCIEACSSDADCSAGEKCCSNGCGHVCRATISVPPMPSSCAAVTCLRGHDCQVVNGVAQCVPPARGERSDECGECLVGFECRKQDDGEPICVKVTQDATCAAVSCLRGTVCEIIDGEARCTPQAQNNDSSITCANVRCAEFCTDSAGSPTCASRNKCKNPPAQSGMCEALIMAWTYDPDQGECREFEYGGCPILTDDNGESIDNRFDTKEACQSECMSSGEQECQVFECLIAPCANQASECPAAARCENDYCNGCNAIYYDQDNNTMTETDCQRANPNCPMFKLRAPELGCEYAFDIDERGCKINPHQVCDVICPVYSLLQPEPGCHYNWTVNERGCEEPKLVCETACETQRNEQIEQGLLSSKVGGADFVVECDNQTNNFVRKQCSAEHCWCVGELTGIEINDTKVNVDEDLDCTEVCPANEEYNQCGSACPATCDDALNANATKICTANCVVGCFCGDGFYRNRANLCVTREQCQLESPPRPPCPVVDIGPMVEGCAYVEEVDENGCSMPRRDCGNMTACQIARAEFDAWQSMNLSVDSYKPECDASGDYARRQCSVDEATNVERCWCVNVNNGVRIGEISNGTSCEQVCPANEKWNDCGSACPPTCQEKPEVCTMQCVAGCECEQGYLRDSASGRCVPEDQCPKQCGENEELKMCGSACPITCDQVIDPKLIACPAVCLTNVCQCKQGYALDSTGACIPAKQCFNGTIPERDCLMPRLKPARPGCEWASDTDDNGCKVNWRQECGNHEECGPNEERVECGTMCPRTCEDVRKPHDKPCILSCKLNACQCKEGFALDQNNRCVLESECFNSNPGGPMLDACSNIDPLPCTTCMTTPSNEAKIIPTHGPDCCNGTIVNCFISPCHSAEISNACSESVHCHDSYCGGCIALHYDAEYNRVCVDEQ